MKIALPFLTILLSTFSSIPTFAVEKQGWFVGASYAFQDISTDLVDEPRLDTLGIIAGYQIDDIFSFEYRLNTSISTDSVALPVTANFDADLAHEIDYQMSFLAKAAYKISRNFVIYGLAGITTTKSHITIHSTEYDFQGNEINTRVENYAEMTDGFTYGVGTSYQLTRDISLFIDYQVLPDFEDGSVLNADWSTTTAGFTYLF